MARHTGVWLALAVLLAAGPCAAGRSPTPPVPAPSAPPDPTSASPVPNRLVSDGGAALSVAGVDCGHRTPAGEYCYVTFRAVNISDGFPVFTEAVQTAYDPSGRAFRPDPAADTIANHGRPITQRLPRGVPVSGILAFPLPLGDRIDHLVLHGNPGTPGQTFTIPQ